MLTNWTPELVKEVLSTVEPRHRSVFHVTQLYKMGDVPSVYFFRKHGHAFSTMEECRQACDEAITAMRRAFRSRGIRMVADLDFHEGERTLEGHLQAKRTVRGSFLGDVPKTGGQAATKRSS